MVLSVVVGLPRQRAGSQPYAYAPRGVSALPVVVVDAVCVQEHLCLLVPVAYAIDLNKASSADRAPDRQPPFLGVSWQILSAPGDHRRVSVVGAGCGYYVHRIVSQLYADLFGGLVPVRPVDGVRLGVQKDVLRIVLSGYAHRAVTEVVLQRGYVVSVGCHAVNNHSDSPF